LKNQTPPRRTRRRKRRKRNLKRRRKKKRNLKRKRKILERKILVVVDVDAAEETTEDVTTVTEMITDDDIIVITTTADPLDYRTMEAMPSPRTAKTGEAVVDTVAVETTVVVDVVVTVVTADNMTDTLAMDEETSSKISAREAVPTTGVSLSTRLLPLLTGLLMLLVLVTAGLLQRPPLHLLKEAGEMYSLLLMPPLNLAALMTSNPADLTT